MAVAPRGQFDPNMVATENPTDPLSPTTLVFNYLKSKGIPLTAGNISQALRDNARDPGVFAPDPVAGLRNARASTDAEDQAAMRAAGRGGGSAGGPSNLVQEEGTWDTRGRPQGATPPMDRRDGATTSAQPATNTSSSPPSDADYSMPAWGTAAGGSGLALANAILNRQPSAQFVGNAQPASGKVTDVDLPPNAALPSPSPMDATFARAGLGGPTITPAIAPPAPQIAGPPPVAEAPVAAPGSTIVPPVTPESNAPAPRTSTTLHGNPPAPQGPIPTVVVRPPGAAKLNPAVLGQLPKIVRSLPR